jgi:hypothetical protein
VAPKRQPKTLLEFTALLAMGTLLTPEQLASKQKLSLMDQARIGVKSLPKATRVGEFIAMWTINKYLHGEVTVEKLAEFWNEPPRTMYRRLDEFRQVWGPAGHDTPDKIADNLIAHYKARGERLNASYVVSLLSAPVTLSVTTASAVPT